MVRDFRQQCPQASDYQQVDPSDPDGIIVCVRKRPIQNHEVQARELDCVTACNPFAIVHESKFKIDGITKCLESHQFEFDRVFDEETTTDEVYRSVAGPLVPWVIENSGRATLFAYGQTGSGKTHTMTGIQRLLAEQIFSQTRRRQGELLEVSISFFEIYGGRPYDLLNSRNRLETLEDARNEVQIAGLSERTVGTPDAMLQCIELGNSLRTTHATAINRDSSRSHAICAVFLRAPATSAANSAAALLGGAAEKDICAKITLVDLAGSERAADSKSSIRQRRVEGAQINKSLLALKECIRAMGDPREAHVPFRASKLTLVLRDAFVSRVPSRTVMIACISPGMLSADHSINTLRYSDRLKDHPKNRSIVDRGDGDDAERGARRASVATGQPPRDAKSPDPLLRSRRRSPSPQPVLPGAGAAPVDAGHHGSVSGGSASAGALQRARLSCGPGGSGSTAMAPMTAAAAVAVVSRDYSKDHGVDLGAASSAADDDEFLDPEDDLPPPSAAWEEEPLKAETTPTDTLSRSGNGTGGRQPVSRRGRQPTLRTGAGVSQRPDALGTRGLPTAPGLSPAAAAPQLPVGAGIELELPRTPEGHHKGAASSPSGRRSDDLLHQQDNQYLHTSIASEVRERRDVAGEVVDVGVQDLADLAHMEALDEVRQWEDRIVSQHMVALQEDARLLTAESELLSQVQQGASYDIDWYVSEVDKVVRRKMEVYATFLEDLEAFKAQLQREESLSRSVQRARVGAAVPPGGLLAAAGEDESPPQITALDREPQRMPRTPRLYGHV